MKLVDGDVAAEALEIIRCARWRLCGAIQVRRQQRRYSVAQWGRGRLEGREKALEHSAAIEDIRARSAIG